MKLSLKTLPLAASLTTSLTTLLAASLAVGGCSAPTDEAVGTSNAAVSERECFAETGKCISGSIAAYWHANGGLPVFGFPITDATQTTTSDPNLHVPALVQWFERDRLEAHQAGPFAGTVQAGRLGAEFLASVHLHGRDFRALAIEGGRGLPSDVAEVHDAIADAHAAGCAVYRGPDFVDTNSYASVCGDIGVERRTAGVDQDFARYTARFTQPSFLGAMRQFGGAASAPPLPVGYGQPDDTVRARFGIPLTQAIDLTFVTRASCDAETVVIGGQSVSAAAAIAMGEPYQVRDACKVLLSDPTIVSYADHPADPNATQWIQYFERRVVEYHPAQSQAYQFLFGLLGRRLTHQP